MAATPQTKFQQLIAKVKQTNGTSSPSTSLSSIHVERSSVGDLPISPAADTSSSKDIVKRLDFGHVAIKDRPLPPMESAFVLEPDTEDNILIPNRITAASLYSKLMDSSARRPKRGRQQPKTKRPPNGRRKDLDHVYDSDGNEGELVDDSEEEYEESSNSEDREFINDDETDELTSTDSEKRPKRRARTILSSDEEKEPDEYSGVVESSDTESSNSEDSGEESCEFLSDDEEESSSGESEEEDDTDEEKKEIEAAKNDMVAVSMSRTQRSLFNLLTINDTPTIPGETSIKNVFGYILSSHLNIFALLDENTAIDPIEGRLKATHAFKMNLKMKFANRNSTIRAYYIWLKLRDIVRQKIFSSEETKVFSNSLADFKTSNNYTIHKVDEDYTAKCAICTTNPATHTMSLYDGKSGEVSHTLDFDFKCSKIFQFLKLWSFPEICSLFVEHHILETYQDQISRADLKDWIKSDADKRHFFYTRFGFVYHYFIDFYQTLLVPLLKHYGLTLSYSSNIMLEI